MGYEEYSSPNEQLPSPQTAPPSVLVLNSSACTPPPPPPTAASESPVLTSPTTSSAKRKAGRKKFRETRHPVYRGVRERNGGKWVCELREPQKKTRIWLGTYATPEMAARAHDVAAIALRGKSASLNFSDSAWKLPRPRSTSPEDIRCAAARAAGMFRPPSPPSPPAPLSTTPWATSGAPLVTNDDGREDGEGGVAVEEAARPPPAPAVFVDEDALLNMSELVNDMARGLLMTPPAMQKGFDWDTVDCNVDWSLWTDD